MNRYNNYGLAPSTLHAFNKSERQHDDRASLSGSEDGNYGLYADSMHKSDVDVEEEANVALTSQTLNPDGTPKRPMNAFMIFARRRRPQVSSENQAMRTGEISKLLSKEWVSMPSHQKQFYLEQAKQLKDTFNTKYPDYVYRRRPNNSRKRRRSDSNMRHSFMTDHSDELLGNGGDLEVEGSPVDSDEHIDNNTTTTMGYRPSHSVSQSFDVLPKYNISQSRCEPPYPSGQYESRQSSSTVERFMHPPPPPPGRHLMQQQPEVNYSYSQYQAPQGWPPRVERLQPTWNNDGQLDGHNNNRQPYSPSTPSSSTWSNSPTTPNYFPTLTTPFYPTPNVGEYPPPPSPIYEPVSQHAAAAAAQMSKEYAPRVYSSTGAIQLENSYPSSRSYSPRNVPPMDYNPNSQPSSSSSSGFQWSRQQ